MPNQRVSWLFSMLALVTLSPDPCGAQSACGRRTIPVSVTDETGNIVPGLDLHDFVVKVHGRPATILSSRLEASPHRIAIVLDASSSVLEGGSGRSDIWRRSLTALARLAERMPPQHSLALLVFADKVDFQTTFTQDRKPILDELNDLQAGRKAFPKGIRHTALWDAILAAGRMFGPPHNGDVILALTDGGDNESVTRPKDVIDTLQQNGLRLFALWPPLLPPPNPVMISKGDFMTAQLSSMTAATGGEYLGPAMWWQADRIQNLESLDKFYAEMVQYYRLEFQLPKSIENRDEVKLEVRDIKSKLANSISYPHRLALCAISGGPS